MSVPTFLIALDRATNEERDAVHEIVKSHANGWWHMFADVWLVGGHSPEFWVDTIGPLIPFGPASILVFRIPDGASLPQDWHYFGIKPNERSKWLRENL
jgi:hypothetical protein